MQFTSVRAINKACQDACYGNLGGKCLYFKKYDEVEPQTLLEKLNAHKETDGRTFKLVRFSRARADRSGQLYVRLSGFLHSEKVEWFPVGWSDIVVQ